MTDTMPDDTSLSTRVANGRWIVRIVKQGELYGRNLCLTHDDPKPMIEFYDTQHPMSDSPVEGQFVSRYYIDTLFGYGDWDGGALSLMGHEPAWTVDADTMREVAWYINEFLEV